MSRSLAIAVRGVAQPGLERYLGVVEVASSNLVAPTLKNKETHTPNHRRFPSTDAKLMPTGEPRVQRSVLLEAEKRLVPQTANPEGRKNIFLGKTKDEAMQAFARIVRLASSHPLMTRFFFTWLSGGSSIRTSELNEVKSPRSGWTEFVVILSSFVTPIQR